MRRSSFVSGRLINPVMTKLIENGIEITAIHNALGYDALARVAERRGRPPQCALPAAGHAGAPQ
jgi:hypothetical protein